MSVPSDAFYPGMRGYAATRIDNVNLAVVVPVITGNELVDDRIRRLALAQKPQTFRAVKRIDERLRCDRSDTCGDERHPGAGGKKLCRDGDAEAAGCFIASNDRPRHRRLSRVIVPRHSPACREDWRQLCAVSRRAMPP